MTATWDEAFAVQCDRIARNSRQRATAAGSITATADGQRAKARLRPGTGFDFYAVGNNPNTDVSGFQMTLGPDGKLYYGTLGPQTCTANFCYSADGAIGQFDPSTGKATEIELHAEGFGVGFTSDGGLWIGGGVVSQKIFHLPAGSFSASALQSMTVPAPSPSVSAYAPGRVFTQDGSGNVWFNDGGGHRVFKNPIVGPYDGSALTMYVVPSGPTGTPQFRPNGQGMAYGGDGNVYLADYNNGLLDQIMPATGSTSAQILTPQQQSFGASNSSFVRYITKDGAGTLFFSYLQGPNGLGGVDSLVPGSNTIHALTLPNAPSGRTPDSIGSKGSYVYYADLSSGGLGFIDTATGNSRLYPIDTLAFQNAASTNFVRTPNGIAVLSDGTAWFTCYGGSTSQPLCLGHTVYLGDWSLFPGPDINISGFGSASSQPVGIMEAPATNSGPFKVTNSKKSVCRVSPVHDHNFVITGIASGACTITVSDARSVKAAVQVTVVASPAPSRTRVKRIR